VRLLPYYPGTFVADPTGVTIPPSSVGIAKMTYPGGASTGAPVITTWSLSKGLEASSE
jgi:hypothetical protein